MSIDPTGQGPTHGANVAVRVGPQAAQCRRQTASDEQVGGVEDGGHEKVGHTGHVRQHRGDSTDTSNPRPVLPARSGGAVAVMIQDALGMGVGELHGDHATHGVSEQHGAAAGLVEQMADHVRDLGDGDALRQRVTASDIGRLGLSTRQPSASARCCSPPYIPPPAK